jgi:glycosyltransferase involved in cell wall biosynthesis
MKPLVSVLILTYNHFNYIEQAIQSVLDQKTNFDFEILIGDDCSTDGTCELVDSFISKYPNLIKAIRSEHNVGALRNEKRLMEASSGKYIAFLEGDDYWTDSLKLKKQVEFLEANPDYGLVHGDVNHYYQVSQKTINNYNKINHVKIPNGQIFNSLIEPSHIIKTMTVCFNKELALKHFNYDIAIKRNWLLTDLPLWLDISFNSKIYYFDQVFSTYRLLEESASNTKSLNKKLEFYYSVCNVFDYYIIKYEVNSEAISKIVKYKYTNSIKFSLLLMDIDILKKAFNKEKNETKYLNLKRLILYKLISNRIVFGLTAKLIRLIK